MYKIVKKQPLNPTVTRMEIEAPLIAKKAQPGQFIILRVDENGERIPLTVAGYDREKGTVTIIFQIVGATTEKLNHLNEGELSSRLRGPARHAHACGRAEKGLRGRRRRGLRHRAIPLPKKLHEHGRGSAPLSSASAIKDLVILEDEFKACSRPLHADDGRRLLRRKGQCHRPAEDAARRRARRLTRSSPSAR